MLHRPPATRMITEEMIECWIEEGAKPGGEKTYIEITGKARKGSIGEVVGATFYNSYANRRRLESLEYKLDTSRTYTVTPSYFKWAFDATGVHRFKEEDHTPPPIRDRLGREIQIDDFISWARGGDIELGNITRRTFNGTLTVKTLGGGEVTIPNHKGNKATNILILSNDLRDVLMLRKLSGEE